MEGVISFGEHREFKSTFRTHFRPTGEVDCGGGVDS